MVRTLILSLVLATEYSLIADDDFAAMTGPWEGNAHIIVNWCQQTNMPVTLTIAADRSVTGKVGDAILTRARIKANRGALGRKLNLKTDFIIVGDLQGPILAPEGITRSSIMMPINFTNNTLVGGIHTSGSKFGRRERGILSAGVTLQRANKP